MATVVLGIVGSYFGGPVGGYVGAAVGAYIDAKYLFPAIFGGPKPLVGPRLDGLGVQTASEGNPINRVLGPSYRTSGTLIWASDLIEEENTEGGGKGTSGPTATTFTYFVHLAVGVCEGPITNIKKIWADSKLIYNQGQKDARYEDVYIYNGDETQLPDALIESFQGTGNVPAFRGLGYVVFQKLALTDFGNRIPNFTFLVEENGVRTVRDAVGLLLQDGGFATTEYDVSSICGQLRGFEAAGPVSTVERLAPLILTYDLAFRDVGGKLYGFNRNHSASLAINASDLAAHEPGNDTPRPLLFEEVAETDLPHQIDVKFMEPEADFQSGNVSERRIAATSNNLQSVDVPLVMTAAEARVLAKRILWTSWAERKDVTFYLPPSYGELLEGDLMSVTVQGEDYSIRVRERNVGNNHLIEGKGRCEEAQTLTHIATSTGPATPTVPHGVYTPPNLTTALMQLPPLREEHSLVAGIYLGVCATDPNAFWKGATLYESHINPTSPVAGVVSYNPLTTQSLEGTIGKATTTLGASQYGSWDNANTLTVQLFNGSFQTRNDLEVLNGANILLVGSEIIGFATVTSLGNRTYRLSRLLRGLRNTADAISTHVANEQVIQLRQGGTRFVVLGNGSLQQTHGFKMVPSHGAVGAYAAVPLTFTGETLRQFPPCAIRGTRDGSNNVTLSWTRRSRSLVRMFSWQDSPLNDALERYEVDIIVGGIVKRTLAVTGATSVAYSAANQTTDGITPGNPVTLNAYMISSAVGRSKPQGATV